MEEVTEQNIIRLLASHSNAAYEYLYMRYYASLKLFCSNIVSNKQEAEDIVQELFVNLLDIDIKFNTEEDLRMYLYRSIKNRAISSIRHSEVCNRYSLEVINNSNFEDDFYEKMVRTDIYATLCYAISRLSPRCAQVMELTLQGYKQSEIAEHLSITVDTVSEYKANGKKKMKLILKALDTFYIIMVPPLFYLFKTLYK